MIFMTWSGDKLSCKCTSVSAGYIQFSFTDIRIKDIHISMVNMVKNKCHSYDK